MQQARSATARFGVVFPWPVFFSPSRCRGWWVVSRRWGTVVVGLLLVGVVSTGPAWAHGGGDGAPEGYVLVQQALGHLAQDPGPKGVAAAEAKIGEALGGPDQDGVDVALVGQAQAELTAGEVVVAQQTLQLSIAEAVGQLEPASGEETGTTVVGEPLPGRGSLTGTDWTFGAVSLVLLVVGVGLALWFRPAENLAELRRGLAGTPDTGSDPATDPSPTSPTSRTSRTSPTSPTSPEGPRS